MYKSVSLACMSVHQIHAWCLLRSEENVGSLELELQSCELPQGCWDSNLGIPQKQVFLTAKLSLQPYKDFFLIMNPNLIIFSRQVVCQPFDLPNNKYLTLQIYTGTGLST